MKKRAISAIVATVLIILITVAAVAIIWGLIIPVFSNGLGDVDYDADVVIVTEDGYTYFDSTNGVYCVQIKRLAGGTNLSRIDVLFSYNGTTLEGNENFSGDEIPGVNEKKQKCFNMMIAGPNKGRVGPPYFAPDSISLVSFYFDGVKEVEGSIAATVNSNSEDSENGNYPGNVGGLPVVGGCESDGACGGLSSEFICNVDNTEVLERVTTSTCTIATGACSDVVSPDETYEDCSLVDEGICYDFGSGGDCYETVITDYQIKNCWQFFNISNELSGSYTLMNNIDCSGVISPDTIGKESDPFTGSFYGGGNTISGLTINPSGHVGLFGYVVGGGSSIIQDLHLEGVDIQGSESVGGLVGHLEGTDVEGVSVTGTVGTLGQSPGGAVGGLIGEIVSSSGSGSEITLRDLSSEVSVSGYSGGDFGAGGLIGKVGFNIGGTFSNLHASGDVSNDNPEAIFIGGLIGLFESEDVTFSGSNYWVNHTKNPEVCCGGVDDCSIWCDAN